jgi:methyl halide transferase
MEMLTREYWENRYKNQEIGWDVGEITTPLKTYIDQLENKNLRILIPGGGNSYEMEYLHQNGFENVFVIDIAKQPLENSKKRIGSISSKYFIHDDFFNLKDRFDLIIEQTFFCALDPILRAKYALKMNELLSENGKIIGLLFQFPLTEKGPPFGGNLSEYKNLFEPFFKIKTLETAYNSIKPRENNELFFIFEKK